MLFLLALYIFFFFLTREKLSYGRQKSGAKSAENKYVDKCSLMGQSENKKKRRSESLLITRKLLSPKNVI